MRRETAFCLLALLLAVAARADDEAKFRPKEYKPRKELRDQSYRAATYRAPEKSTRMPAKSYAATKADAQPRWNEAGAAAKTLQAEPAPQASSLQADAYRQEKHTSVPTISADTRAMAEKKMFEARGKELEIKGYKADAKPQPKNPLLKPRQGIKEPPK